MEFQLNAAPDEDYTEDDAMTASSSVSHAVRMSSLLSEGTGTPRNSLYATESASPSGHSSLMHPPVSGGQEGFVLSRESEPVVNEIVVLDDVNMEEEEQQDERVLEMPKLQSTELQRLQAELLTSLTKLWTEAVPAPKRQKKGKQPKRGKAAGNGNNSAEIEVHRVLDELQRTVNRPYADRNVVIDVVKLCLAFCELVDENHSVESLVVRKMDTKNKAVDLDETVKKLLNEPIYGQLTTILKHAVFCGGEETGKQVLRQMLDWCLARPMPSSWTWVFVSVTEMNSYSVQECLFREAIVRYQSSDESQDQVQHLLPVLESLAEKHPAQMVDILRDVLHDCESSSDRSADTVIQLVKLASDSAALVSVCDDGLQWVVTEELVKTLASKFGKYSAKLHAEPMEAQLLKFIRRRSAELSNSGFQLLLLLQSLSTSNVSSQFNASVTSFQNRLYELAESEPSHAFVRAMYQFLPYICQNALRLLRVITQTEEAPSTSGTAGVDGEMSGKTASQQFKEWKQWLCLLARSVSCKEVTEMLIKTDLMLAECNDSPSGQIADGALCELLTSLLAPASPEYVAFVRNIVYKCESAAPRAQWRILGIVQMLLNVNYMKNAAVANYGLPITLDARQDASCLQQLVRSNSWTENMNSFGLWNGIHGVEFWESFLDLMSSKNALVASRALLLVSQTPFLSLDDPAWQYRCVRKLTRVFFSVLRQYRSTLVMRKRENSGEARIPFDTTLQSRLQTLKMIMLRVVTLRGGVARYPCSVYSMFASMWLDALLSTTSATSIPTHFPETVNFVDLDTKDELDEDQIIRSERTISSKCTNLQSSQVITKVAETKLVYRKTLDSSWECEMHAARICSMSAIDLFSQLLGSTGVVASPRDDGLGKERAVSNSGEDELLDRRLTTVVDMLLERVVPCCGIPSDDVYKDMLPNRSSFDVDLRVEQWLNHFPAFLPLLRAVISSSLVLNSSQLLRLVPVFKSILIVLLGHWNSVKGNLSVENVDVPPYMRNKNQLAITCELVRLLRATNWLPVPLGKTAELLPLTTPADIRAILFSCWFYLSDHPPKTGSRASAPATSAPASPISSDSSPIGAGIPNLSSCGPSSSTRNPPLEFYLIPLRKALHRNISKIGAKYPLFSC
uniref:Integrator complex subunit 5 C-terminal domain-containing protein n=1 Tax=Peronospora matthiolae TaxID=2874970 RepID=A0AAV1UBP7_9STRA